MVEGALDAKAAPILTSQNAIIGSGDQSMVGLAVDYDEAPLRIYNSHVVALVDCLLREQAVLLVPNNMPMFENMCRDQIKRNPASP